MKAFCIAALALVSVGCGSAAAAPAGSAFVSTVAVGVRTQAAATSPLQLEAESSVRDPVAKPALAPPPAPAAASMTPPGRTARIQDRCNGPLPGKPSYRACPVAGAQP
jgi:hypothetical protein